MRYVAGPVVKHLLVFGCIAILVALTALVVNDRAEDNKRDRVAELNCDFDPQNC